MDDKIAILNQLKLPIQLTMKRITTILLLFTSLSISAQELISNIQSEGNLQRYLLTEVEESQYILAFDALDSIKIYEVQEDGYSLTNTHYNIGSYNQFYYQIFGKWLLLEGAKDAFALNILTGEEVVFESEEGFVSSHWSIYGKNAILRQSLIDFSESEYFLIDEEMEVVDIDDWYRDVRKITDDYAILQKSEDDARVIYRADIVTHEQWEVTRFYEGEYFELSNDQIFSFKNNKVEITNIADGSVEELYSLTFEPNRRDVNALPNYFIFTASNQDEAVTLVYSKTSNKIVVWPYEVYQYLRKSPADRFITEHPTEYHHAQIYNFEDGSTADFPAINIDQSILIDDRYLINRVYFDIEIYDLELNSATVATGDLAWPTTRNWEVLKTGDKAHIYVETVDERINELTTLEISHFQFSSASLPTVQRGLNRTTQLFPLGEDIIVGSDEHIFSVVEDELVQLNTAPIIETNHQPFLSIGNQLFWAENLDSLVHFHSFENGTKNLEAVFGTGNSPVEPDNFRILEYINGYNSIFIFGIQSFDFKRLLLNKETGNVINISDIPYSLINSARFHKDYFYTLSDSLYAVDETGLVQTVDMPIAQLLFSNSTIYDGDLFVTGADGLYKIEGLEATKVLDHDNIFVAFFEEIADLLVYDADDQSFIYKDGIWNEWTKIEDVWYTNFDDEYLQVVNSIGTNLTETQLFHISENEYIDLPVEIRNRRIVSRFTSFENQYIISYFGFLPTYDVKIHQVNEDFSEVEEIHSFQSVGRGLSAHFEEFENEGFLYIGNKLFLMNEDLEFIPLEGVFGDTENVTAVEKDGYFYFIGFHPELGRQVWNVQAFSERVSVKDLEKMTLKIYPNPSDHLLFISDDKNPIKGSYTIYSTSGNVVERGKIDNAAGIDIRNLTSGFYYLKYTDNASQTLTAPFFKQ